MPPKKVKPKGKGKYEWQVKDAFEKHVVPTLDELKNSPSFREKWEDPKSVLYDPDKEAKKESKKKPKDLKSKESKHDGKKEDKLEEGGGEDHGMGTALNEKNKEAAALVKNIPLQPFDFDKISLDSMICAVGKRRYGKSVWVEWMLSHLWPFFPRGGFVFTKTKHNYFWQKHFPENRIYQDLYPELVTQILETQKALYQAILDGATLDSSPFICIVFDDVIANKDIRYSQQMAELAWAGRHYFIFCVICAQDVKGLPPGFRGNMDLIASTYQTQRRTMETMQEDFADFFDNKYVFEQLIQQNTRDHGMLIIDQTEAKYDVGDVFFNDKAPDPKKVTMVSSKNLGPLRVKGPVYKIGDKDYWKAANNNWKEQLFKAQNIPDPSREKWNNWLEECSTDEDCEDGKDGVMERDLDAVQPMLSEKVSTFSENFMEVDQAEDTSKPKEKRSHWEECQNKVKLLAGGRH